ncbi:MAG: hypothetical protein VYA84_20390 [Planctomycetota bacterium]|nr:hypothetical protein [Planctomycetota bacterium]
MESGKRSGIWKTTSLRQFCGKKTLLIHFSSWWVGCRKHVRVWHESTRRWVAEVRLQLVRIIQEQHADRCRLLGQQHGFDWPILHDPINVLGTTAVPMFLAIDEHSIVRSTRARLDNFESLFLNQTF